MNNSLALDFELNIRSSKFVAITNFTIAAQLDAHHTSRRGFSWFRFVTFACVKLHHQLLKLELGRGLVHTSIMGDVSGNRLYLGNLPRGGTLPFLSPD